MMIGKHRKISDENHKKCEVGGEFLSNIAFIRKLRFSFFSINDMKFDECSDEDERERQEQVSP